MSTSNTPTSSNVKSLNSEDIIKSSQNGMSIKPLNYEPLPFSNYPKLNIDTSISPPPKMEVPPAPTKTPSPSPINKNVITNTIQPPKLIMNIRSPPKAIPTQNHTILRSPPRDPQIISPSNNKIEMNDITNKNISSPLRSPPKYRTMIPISNNIESTTTPIIKTREDIYKKTPPKVESLAIPHVPQIPHIKVQPVGEIRGKSPIKIPQNISQNTNINIPLNNQRTWFENITSAGPSIPQRPNYNMMSTEEMTHMKSVFIGKFGTLKSSFPNWDIKIPDESSTLDYWHDIYESYVKRIVISMSTNTWKMYMVIFYFGIQAVCKKYLGIEMKNFALSQYKMIKQYDQLFVELGEKQFLQGPSNLPVEMRIMSSTIMNIGIFLAIKYIAISMGGESLADPIQEVISSLLSGMDLQNAPTVQKDENGLSSIPQSTNGGGDFMSGLLNGNMGSLLGNLMNGNGGNIQSLMTNVLAAVGNSNSPQVDPKIAPIRNVVFTEDD